MEWKLLVFSHPPLFRLVPLVVSYRAILYEFRCIIRDTSNRDRRANNTYVYLRTIHDDYSKSTRRIPFVSFIHLREKGILGAAIFVIFATFGVLDSPSSPVPSPLHQSIFPADTVSPIFIVCVCALYTVLAVLLSF